MQLHVLDPDAVHLPEGLIGIGDLHVFKRQILHLTKELRTVDTGVRHHQIVGVPDGRARAEGGRAVVAPGPVGVPPRILTLEFTAVGLHIPALFDARLTIGNRDIL